MFSRASFVLALALSVLGCTGSTTSPDGGGSTGGGTASGGGTGSSGAAVLATVLTSDAEMGGQGTLRLTLLNPVSTATSIALTSSTTAVATVPATVTIPAGAASADVAWSGVAVGPVAFDATLGDTVLTATANVVNAFACGLYRSSVQLEAGADVVTSVYCGGRFPDSRVLAFTSSDSSVMTVSTAHASPFQSNSYYTVHGVAPGVANVQLDSRVVGSARVVDHARLSQLSVDSVALVGAQVPVQVSLDSVAANAKTVSLSGVGSAASLSVAPGSSYGQVNVVPTTAGQFTLSATLDSVTLTRSVKVVQAPSLNGLSISQQPLAVDGTSGPSYLYVSLDVAPNGSVDVALTSSDPTVLTVPATLGIIGTTSSGLAMTPLKPGVVIITATVAGVSLSTVASVVATAPTSQGNSLSMYLSNQQVLVGGLDSVSVQSAPDTVTLTSSDPTVVSLQGATNAGYSTVNFFGAKAGTATITATSAGQTASVLVKVLANQSINFGSDRVDVVPGSSVSTQLTLAAEPLAGTTVSFTSSAPSIVAAPASFVAQGSYLPVPVKGLANGSAVITAHVGSASAFLLVNVSDGSQQVPRLSYAYATSTALQVGALTVAVVSMSPQATSDTPVTVTFEPQGVVSVASGAVLIPSGSNQARFVLTGVAPGTTTATLSALGTTQTFSVKVAAQPTLNFSLNTSTAKVGATVLGTVSADLTLVHDLDCSVLSSAPAVASVPASVRVAIGDGEESPSSSFGVKALTAGPATITVTCGTTVLTQAVTIAP